MATVPGEIQEVTSPVRYFACHPKGKPLQSQAKQIILNVYSKIREENPGLSVKDVARRTALLTGVGDATVFRLKQEFLKGGVLRTPGKSRPAAKGNRTRMHNMDDFTKTAIRRKVHEFYRRNESPSAEKVTAVINSDPDLPNVSVRTTIRVLKDLSFSFRKVNRSSILIERDDIVTWRHKYIRDIRRYRRENKTIYYLDETYVNAGHTVGRAWQDTTIKSGRQAAIEGLSTGVSQPRGKGGRLIVAHIGSNEGFVDESALIFHAKKGTGDYHQEMDGPKFEGWFESVLPKLTPNSVIVLDNAPYHSVKLERVPNMSWKKADIQTWLSTKANEQVVPSEKEKYSWTTCMIKSELIEIVNTVKGKYSDYRVDILANQHGHTVVRLPPYHCELNPIEQVWSEVKRFVAANNTQYTLLHVQQLLHDGIERVTAAKWRNYIVHAIKEENQMWDADFMNDDQDTVQPVIINLRSEEEESDSDSSISGIEELL